MAKAKKFSEPSRPTTKRLFNSYRECAFTGCTVPAIDPTTGSVLLEIAHIRGEKPAAARFDPDQSDEQRQHFDNLTLLCGVHHKLADDNPVAFPPEVLATMKSVAELAAAHDPPTSSATDAVVDQALRALTGATVHGSVVINQGSGQAAHSIVNIGRPSRRIPHERHKAYADALRPFATRCELSIPFGDSEALRLAQDIVQILRLAGWQLNGTGINHVGWTQPVTGFRLHTPVPFPPAAEALAALLVDAGLCEPPLRADEHSKLQLVVGSLE